MQLFEAIIEANHRAIAGDTTASLNLAEFTADLPIIALTCLDPRLTRLFPDVLGVPREKFIWLRTAGNTVSDPIGNVARGLAIGTAVNGGKEIVVIGHTDCLMCKTSEMKLAEAFRGLGIERNQLPEDIAGFFGLSNSEQQNVVKAVQNIRRSPLIAPHIPVHGLLVNVETGKLEWVVNGYQALEMTANAPASVGSMFVAGVDTFKNMAEFKIGEMKFPESKIGEIETQSRDWLSKNVEEIGDAPAAPKASTPPVPAPSTSAAPPAKIPIPPRIPTGFKPARQ